MCDDLAEKQLLNFGKGVHGQIFGRNIVQQATRPTIYNTIIIET